MKILKFTQDLVKPTLAGENTSTWRLFDDKDLKKGDSLSLVNSENGKEFAKAKIVDVSEKKFEDLTEADYKGHRRYESKEEMYAAFKEYYKLSITPSSILKIVYFELI